MIDFEKWFSDQDFYTNMRFIHGDALFAKDGDVYRVLPVQIAYKAWQTARYKTKDEHIALTQEWHQKGWDDREKEITQLKAQLIDQGQRFNDQSQKVRDLEFKCEGLEKRIYSALMLLQRNQLYIPALAMGQIGKVLRGGHE